MREVMNISGGYELITGIFFGAWLLASAAGSAMAGRSGMNDIRKINLAFSASQVISFALLILLSRIFLESGETPGFAASIMMTFIMLLPFCFVSGFAFIKLISLAKTLHNYVPGKSFTIETTGSIVAGILLSVLTSGLLNTGQIILVIMILSPPIFTLTSASPGVKTLNNAGTAIKRENSGMKIKVLLRKNRRPMLEQYVKSKHSA